MPRKKKENPDEVIITQKEEETKPKQSEYSKLSVGEKGNVGGSIEFWTKRELGKNGKPLASYPLTYNERIITEKKEELNGLIQGLEYDAFPPAKKPEIKQRINHLRDEIKDIEAMRNQSLTGIQKDYLADFIKETAAMVSESEPTYDEDKKGTADVTALHRRNKEFTFPISNKFKPLVEKLGGQLYNGKMRGDDMKRCLKIALNRMGEPSNLERFRREGSASGVYQSKNEIVSEVLEKIAKGHIASFDPEYAAWLAKKKDED